MPFGQVRQFDQLVPTSHLIRACPELFGVGLGDFYEWAGSVTRRGKCESAGCKIISRIVFEALHPEVKEAIRLSRVVQQLSILRKEAFDDPPLLELIELRKPRPLRIAASAASKSGPQAWLKMLTSLSEGILSAVSGNHAFNTH